MISAHCECCDLQWQLVQVLSTFISEHLPEQRLYSNDTRLNVTIKIWKMWCVLNDINKLVVSQLNLLRSPRQSSQQSSENNEQTPCVGGAQACTTCQVKVKQILICSSLPRQHPKFVSTRTIMYFHTDLNWEINVNLKKSKSIIPFICQQQNGIMGIKSAAQNIINPVQWNMYVIAWCYITTWKSQPMWISYKYLHLVMNNALIIKMSFELQW